MDIAYVAPGYHLWSSRWPTREPMHRQSLGQSSLRGAAEALDAPWPLSQAGFAKVLLRGDTDFRKRSTLIAGTPMAG